MSMAWNQDRLVEKVADTPFSAMRKCFLTYKNHLTTIAKLTLNGVNYDFEKQATKGVVVCGYHYDSLTFFLPDNRDPMTFEEAETMTLNSYFEMLGSSDYAAIPAWDQFVEHLHNAIVKRGYANSVATYTMTTNNTNYSASESGSLSFGDTTTARKMFEIFADTLSSETNAPLTQWMADDGAIIIKWVLSMSGYSVTINMTIGRK